MICMPKQMKGFLAVCNYASLAAPLMDSPKGKYQGGQCKVSEERNVIEWNEIMKQSFIKIEEVLCEKSALYIPNDTGEYVIHTHASDFGIGGVLQQRLPDGSWAPCAIYWKALKGQIRYGTEGKGLGFTGQRASSVREKETYALVPCLLKFESWISGHKGTVSTATSPSSPGTRKISVPCLDPWLVADVGTSSFVGTTLLSKTGQLKTRMLQTG